MNDFTKCISKRLLIKNPDVPQFATITDSDARLFLMYDEEFIKEYNITINEPDILDQDDIDMTSDEYINTQLALPRGNDNEMQFATVKHRVLGENNLPIGKPNANPILDSRQYQVDYLDDTLEILSANIIAENLLSQVDSEGHINCLLDEIVDHRCDNNAMSSNDNMYQDKNDITHQRYTTKG